MPACTCGWACAYYTDIIYPMKYVHVFFCDYIINSCSLMQYIYQHSSKLLHMHWTYFTIWITSLAHGQDMIKITKPERWAHFLGYTGVTFWKDVAGFLLISLIARFMGPTWGPPGSCQPRVDPMLAPWTLLSGILKPVWNVPHFSGNIYWCIFVKKFYKFVPKGQIVQKLTWLLKMAWCHPATITWIYFDQDL